MTVNSEKAIYHLLKSDSSLTAIVPISRIYDEIIPIDATLPAVAYNHVSTVEDTSIGLTTIKSRSRIQVTVAAKTSLLRRQVLKLVKNACNNKQGTFNGVVTDSVILELIGPSYRDDDAGVFYGSIDFRIAYND